MSEVIRYLAARKGCSVGRGVAVRWTEAIREIPETLCVDTMELDGEIRRSAVVLRIEPIRLATGRRADLNDLDIDTLQAVYDRLAGGARGRARQYEYAG